MKIAAELRDKLGLHKHSLQIILSHIKSSKGKVGKTAGCFSLLMKEYQAQDGMKSQSTEQNQKEKDNINDPNILAKIQTKKLEKDVNFLPLIKPEGAVKGSKTPLGRNELPLQQSRRTGLQRKVIRSPTQYKSLLKKRKCEGKENEFIVESLSLPLRNNPKL